MHPFGFFLLHHSGSHLSVWLPYGSLTTRHHCHPPHLIALLRTRLLRSNTFRVFFMETDGSSSTQFVSCLVCCFEIVEEEEEEF
jgi:hypothetical protein